MLPKFYRFLLAGLLYLGQALWCSAQELPYLRSPGWNREDTSLILNYINQGIPLLYSDPDSAIVLLKKAEQQSRRTGFADGIGYSLVFIGQAMAYKGKYEEAFARYREALPYCLRARYIPAALPALYINIGVSHKNRGNYEQANSYYHKALQHLLLYLPEDKFVIVAYNNLSALQIRQDNYSEALIYAQKAESLAAQKKIPAYQVSSLINMGSIYTALEKEDSAFFCFNKGLDLAKGKEYTDMQQVLLTGIGDLYLRQGNPQSAIPYFKQALQLSTKTNPLYSSLMPGYSLGTAFFQLKAYKDAEEILLSSIDMAEQTGLMENKQIAHYTLAEVYEATGRHEKALQQYRIYQHLKDSITGLDKTKAISEIEAKYNTEQKDKLIAEHQLQISEQQRSLDRNRMITLIIIGFVLLSSCLLWAGNRYRRKTAKRKKEVDQLKAIMNGEEQERDRIARELHDGIGGMLTGIQLNLTALIEKKEPSLRDLEQLANRIKSVGEEVHKTAHNLTPGILQQHSLWQALNHYCEQFEANGGLQIELQFMGDLETLEKPLELTLYRIIQELIQNIARHARARHVAVQLRSEENKLYLSVEDDGIGFDTQLKKNGLGLQHIQTRIAALNGYCAIASAPGKGTSVYIEIDRSQ